MAAVNTFVIVSFAVFLLFCIGIHNFFTDIEENGCEMTYMFEYPQYVKISLPPDTTKKYSRYGLYAYGEGQYTEKLRHMIFTGIPVLFIPGNSGSHKQVRSLASVSLRKAISSHSRFHFDYFSVDFNEEYSALFGGVLIEQTEFVHNSIKKILSLYGRSPSQPDSVVLVGHSMGGVVARGLFMLPNFNASLVKVIVTLATPHTTPVLSVDWYLTSYYTSVNQLWTENREGKLSNVTFVSLGGGDRDLMVQSALTILPSSDINILTTDVPTVWLSTDHLCSLWCKQLVLVLVRAFFDIVDITTKQITSKTSLRKEVFNYHLVHRTGGKRFAVSEHPRQLLLSSDAEWVEYLQRKHTITQPHGLHSTQFIMVRLLSDEKHRWLTAVATGLEAKDWVFVCSADVIWKSSRICDSGINLSNESVFLPSTSSKKKMIHLDLLKLKNNTSFSHVVFRLLPTSNPVQLHIDVHSSKRHLSVSLPKIFSYSQTINVLSKPTDEEALHYKLYLPELKKVWQAYLLHIQPVNCRRKVHQMMATLHVPWGKEAVHKLVTERSRDPLKIKLQSPKPLTYNGSESAYVDLILDVSCQYYISLQPSVADSLGQLVRFYSTQLPAYVTAVLLLVLHQQYVELSRTGSCVMFHNALGTGGKAYHLLLIVAITSQLLRLTMKVVEVPFLKASYLIQTQYLGIDTLIISSVFYMVAFTVVFMLGVLCWAAIIFCGQAAQKMALRFLAKAVTGFLVLSDWTLSALSHLPATVALILVALTFSTCGALSLCVGVFFFFLLLCKMYEDYLEELLRMSLHYIARTLKGGISNKEKVPVKNDELSDNLNENGDEDDTGNKSNEESEETIEETSEEQDSINSNTLEQISKERDVETEKKTENDKGTNNADAEEGNDSSSSSSSDDDDDTDKNTSDGEVEDMNETNQLVTSSPEKGNKNDENPLSALHFNFTVLLIWLAVSIFNVPSVLVWAHNYRYNKRLDCDPSLPVSITLCTCAAFLWQTNVPKSNLKYYDAVSKILYGLAVAALCCGPSAHYILSPLLTVAVAVVTIHQMCFPNKSGV